MNQPNEISSNVQALIDQLHDEGVVAGQTEGQKIIADAESRAQWIIDQAKKEAEEIRQAAQKEAQFIEHSAHSALQLAARDLMLSIKEQLQHHLANQLQSLVAQQLAERDFMIALLQEAVEQQWFAHQGVKFLLPERILDVTDISDLGNQAEDDPLLPAIRKLTESALQQGITLETRKGLSGLHIQYAEGKVEIVTDAESLAQWLLQFVHPRFRALIDGVIR